MLTRTFGLLSSCALVANSFLLPPVLSSNKDSVLPFVALDPKQQYYELGCATCKSLTAVSSLRADTSDNVASSLLLNFTISEDGQALLLNDKQLYPLAFTVKNHDVDWTLPLLLADADEDVIALDDASTELHVTGHVTSSNPITPGSDEGIITMRWQLLALEHELVTVDEVVVQLVRLEDGELLILSIDSIPTPEIEDIYTIQPFKPTDALSRPSKNCKYLPGPLCDIFDSMDQQFNDFTKAKPCHGAKKNGLSFPEEFNPFEGRLPTHIRPHFGQPEDNDMPEFMGPPGHGPHKHGHHGHHGHHDTFQAIADTLESIIIPVILGLAVGLIVVPLGFLTGRLIGWFWFTAFRGGKRGYARVTLDDDSEDKSRESFESVEPLPQYEDAPAYEQTEKEAL